MHVFLIYVMPLTLPHSSVHHISFPTMHLHNNAVYMVCISELCDCLHANSVLDMRNVVQFIF